MVRAIAVNNGSRLTLFIAVPFCLLTS
jgi:hypothetical protein